MSRRAWIVLVVVLVAAFAVVVGGFLWPRPQFRKGPWAPQGSPEVVDSVPAESLPADAVPGGSLP